MYIEMDRYELGFSDLGIFNTFRIMKFNRTMPVLNGSYTLNRDLDDDYEIGFTCARSPLGNNQYQEYPMKLSRLPICQFIKSYGHEYQHLYLNYSNTPYCPPEGFCPFPKGLYWFKNMHIDSNIFPPVFPEGYYRCYLDVYHVPTKKHMHHQAFYTRIRKELLKTEIPV
ncbi:uncharacterized protein LOC129754642 [Uranotaenia lowii]|uniref:uncharacterized protein LOC129754642 n=1 Tax=Uranotaenia lowii TaxID=190385 RepID=UPI0024797BE1|nr:uncharacterized protein LOC129754642 [Uranotaenia lowii]